MGAAANSTLTMNASEDLISPPRSSAKPPEDESDGNVAYYLPFMVMAAAFFTFLCMTVILCKRWCGTGGIQGAPPTSAAAAAARSPRTAPASHSPANAPPYSYSPDGVSNPAADDYIKPPPYCELPPSYEELFLASSAREQLSNGGSRNAGGSSESQGHDNHPEVFSVQNETATIHL